MSEKPFADMSTTERMTWAASLALERFVETGGDGLRSAMFLVMEVASRDGFERGRLAVIEPVEVIERAEPRPHTFLSIHKRHANLSQEDWLVQWAKDHGGIVRVSEVRPVFIAAGLTHAKRRNVYGNIFGILDRSTQFERSDTGTFQWLSGAVGGDESGSHGSVEASL